MIFAALNVPPVTLWPPLLVMAWWPMCSTAWALARRSWMVAPFRVSADGPMLMPFASTSSAVTV